MTLPGSDSSEGGHCGLAKRGHNDRRLDGLSRFSIIACYIERSGKLDGEVGDIGLVRGVLDARPIVGKEIASIALLTYALN